MKITNLLKLLCAIPLLLSFSIAFSQLNAGQKDEALPRNLTPWEKAYIERNPIISPRSSGPPTGPIFCPGEYYPSDAILISWMGTSAWKNILVQLAKHITGPHGNADLYVAVTSTANQSAAYSSLSSGGVDMNRVHFVMAPLDSIWIRDYGPRYIFQDNVRAIIDHTYNRPRPNDNKYPGNFALYKNHAIYLIPLVHGGGNFQHSNLGDGYATALIKNENPSLTESQIKLYWLQYQNLNVGILPAFSTNVDATQHLDMWLFIPEDRTVVISYWPDNQGSAQSNICENAAAQFASNGYTVYRTPAYLSGGTHYTYTNVLICNNVLVVPTYTQGNNVSARNTEAFNTWKQAAPGKEVVQVSGQPIVTAAGVFHCIVMHLPKSPTAPNPATYVLSPNGNENYNPGDQVEIKWISDDDKGVANVDILLSLDGGVTYPFMIASATQDDGSYMWTVPDVFSNQARVKVLARDADGNTGGDASDNNFTINGTSGAVLKDFAITEGKKKSGGLTELMLSDNYYLVGNSLPAFGRPVPGPIKLVVGLETGILNPSQLKVQIETKTSQGGVTGKVYLKNWNTNDFEQIMTYVPLTSDSLFEQIIGGGSQYIRNDGRIELLIENILPIQNPRNGFDAFFDLVRVEVKP